jgi:predicted transcriptional regulator of viral defense system
VHDAIAAGPDHGRLFELASEQSGHFTAAQARACGFSKALVAHHAKTGRFIRVRQGVYRLREYPSSPREEVVAAWLAAGKEAAVVSHESALDILGLSDAVPERIHVTVPRTKRYRSATPGIAVHTTSRKIRSDDLVVRDGLRVTAPTRSIVDAAASGTAPEQVMAAVLQALDRGMTTKTKLLAAARSRGGRVARLIRRAFEERRQGEVPKRGGASSSA